KLFRPHMERGWSPRVQLDAMDEEGIDLAALYPSRGLNVLSLPAMDPEFAAALARAYNNWLYEFCQLDTSKLLGAGMISVFDIETAIFEAKRGVKQSGFARYFYEPMSLTDITGKSRTMTRCGPLSRISMCRWVSTSPIHRRRPRWASNLDTTLCYGIPFPTRSNRCWRWEAFAAAGFLAALPSFLLVFSVAT